MFGLFGSVSYATLVCVPAAYPTIDQIVANNTSCDVNNTEQFNNFSFTTQATGTTPLNPADVQFQILQGMAAVGPYLIFPESYSVTSPPSGVDVNSSFTFGYTVSGLNSMVITAFNGHIIGAAQHDGSSSVTIDYCAGGPVSSCPAGQGGVLDVNSVDSIETVTLPAGAALVNFLITGTIDSPDQGSNASMNSFEMGFQSGSGTNTGGTGGEGGQVPEPGTGLSLSLGLLLLGIGCCRRSRRLAA